ncbi:hypothetical protein DMB42_02255 [Nonomuraea sp. WAC 01424]|nr:hypothetical protein DMB42_02255 [Nonomuraea sp. WAC 01424]
MGQSGVASSVDHRSVVGVLGELPADWVATTRASQARSAATAAGHPVLPALARGASWWGRPYQDVAVHASEHWAAGGIVYCDRRP